MHTPGSRPSRYDGAMRLQTARLELFALDLAAANAWAAGDVARLRELTGMQFPPLAPPLIDEDMLKLRDLIASAGARWIWALWAFAQDGVVIGAGGAGAGPQPDGAVAFGYSIYPEHQRQGFATEAARALVQWYFTHPEVRLVRATVPPGHTPSIRVVEKCGLVRVGTMHDPEVGAVDTFERQR